MVRWEIPIAFLLVCVAANEAHAQVVKFDTGNGYPKAGTDSGYVLVKGTVDLNKATKCTEVLVWAYQNGNKISSSPLKLAVDLMGNWGGANGTNIAGPAGTPNGVLLTITVQAVSGSDKYKLQGSAKSKE